MSREVLAVRVKLNRDSLQVFEKGVYVGSISLSELARLVRSKGRHFVEK